ncbi:MAG: hypothetical protein Q4B44_07640 [Erysipelotrichaceae bacterium]|jgi:hypothetical protein|nr:hypothetical protein [Erysipelotrichaceae bacterium]
MKDKMIMTAVEETGLPAENREEIRASVKDRDYARAKNLLHEGRDSLLAEIHQKEDEIRHIDWIIYTLGRAES